MALHGPNVRRHPIPDKERRDGMNHGSNGFDGHKQVFGKIPMRPHNHIPCLKGTRYNIAAERLNRKQWAAVGLGFVGILLIFKPDVRIPIQHHLAGLNYAIFTALSFLSIRELKRYYDTRSVVMSFMLTGVVASMISMILGEWITDHRWDFMIGKFVMPQGMQWFWVLLMGLLAMGVQIFNTLALGAEKAGIVGVVSYSSIVFAMILGTILGDKLPDTITILGIICIIASGIYISIKKDSK